MARREIVVSGPDFDRNPSAPAPLAAPSTRAEWDGLADETAAKLKARGLQRWDGDLWLFPAEWYGAIPRGLRLVSINGETVSFVPGQTSDDRRFGALAFGVVRK